MFSKSKSSGTIVAMLCVFTLVLNLLPALLVNAQSTVVYVSPTNYVFDNGNATLGQRFNITVRVDDVVNLAAFQVKVVFNDTIINATRWFEPTWDPEYVFYGDSTVPVPAPPVFVYEHVDPDEGSAQASVSTFPISPFTGNGLFCVFEFEITAVPPSGETYSCSLSIDNPSTYLLDPNGQMIGGITFLNGYYEYFNRPYTVLNVDTAINYYTIQEAIDDVATLDGHTLLVAAGVFNLGSGGVVINKELTLIGAGPNDTILDGGSAGTVVEVSEDNVVITGFTIRNSGTTFPDNCGIKLQSSYNEVTGNIILNNDEGVRIDSGGQWNLVWDNRFTLNSEGLVVVAASNTNVTGNELEGNSVGISFAYANDNTVTYNNITNNSVEGIALQHSERNLFKENNVSLNTLGVSIQVGAESNSFFYNSLVDNTVQASASPAEVNTWDNGFPYGGNFWSDYGGNDTLRGQYQNVTGKDGLGDTPYSIDAFNVDNYPLMGYYGPFTMEGENVTVYPTPEVCVVYENSTSQGYTSVELSDTGPDPPAGFKIVGQYFDIQTTTTYDGTITIRIVYDDSGMSLEEEQNLTLLQWEDPPGSWVDITTHVDWINNVIYGETTHLSIFGVSSTLFHDLSISSLDSPGTIVCEGYSTNITVTILNLGDYHELLNITVYVNTTVIGEVVNQGLAGGDSYTFTVVWDTTGFPRGIYVVSADVDVVPGETSVGDNMQVDGTVLITVPGDVTGDGKCNMQDVFQVILHFGFEAGQPGYNANYDINNDGKTDMQDIFITVLYFGTP